MTKATLRQLTSKELARTQANMESWHRERARLREQEEDWFGARFHLEQLLKRKPADADLQARWEHARSQWLKSLPAGQ